MLLKVTEPVGWLRRLLVLAACVMGVVTVASAAQGSFVVLQDNDQRSLVRISTDGKSVQTIAKGAAGVGLAIEKNGSYIVGARTCILRVTRAGAVKQVAAAPGGSMWTAVALDSSGNIIVADAWKPTVWRISPDGQSVVEVASYDELTLSSGSGRRVALAVDDSGDYLLLAEGTWLRHGQDAHHPRIVGPQHFYRITPTGGVTEVELRGGFNLNVAVSLVPSQHGGYLVGAPDNPGGIFRLQGDTIAALFESPGRSCCITGVAEDPETGAVAAVAGAGGRLLRFDKGGAGFVENLLSLVLPQAILYDPGP